MRINEHVHTRDSESSVLVKEEEHIFSGKGKIVSLFSFINHVMSVMTTQFCHCIKKIARDDT